MLVWKDDSITSLINELLRVRFSLAYITKRNVCTVQRVSQINGTNLSHPRRDTEDLIILLRLVNKEL